MTEMEQTSRTRVEWHFAQWRDKMQIFGEMFSSVGWGAVGAKHDHRIQGAVWPTSGTMPR